MPEKLYLENEGDFDGMDDACKLLILNEKRSIFYIIQTFYIAVNLVDLYLSKEYHMHKSDFQLAGASAMFIASKLE